MSVKCFKYSAYKRFLRGFFNAKIAKIIAKNAMTIAFY
jgi:hypothetical protein